MLFFLSETFQLRAARARRFPSSTVEGLLANSQITLYLLGYCIFGSYKIDYHLCILSFISIVNYALHVA